MKKILLCAAGMLLPFFLVSAAQAGAIDNKTNWSAEYVRTLNRNAATDFADIAAYNPAGTVKLHEGFTVNGSVQYLSKDYENNITIAPGTTLGLESDEPSYIPGIFAVYNKKRFSIFGAFSNVGGGGKVDFSQGDASTLKIASSLLGLPLCGGSTCVNLGSQQLSAESYYLGYTLGGAYAFNDMVSISIGMRYVNATRKANGSATIWDAGYTNSFKAAIDYEQEDNGWGGIFGLNLAPNDQVNIAMRYETKTSLDLEATVNAGAQIIAGLDPAIINGQSIPRDLPAIFAFGISYKLNPTMRVEANYTHYFNENADWGGAEDLVDDGYDAGIAFEYLFNEKLLGSIGYIHTKLGVSPENMLPENPELDANTLGAGIAYTINEKLLTNLAIANSFYNDASFVAPPLIEYKKNVFFVGLGAEYRF